MQLLRGYFRRRRALYVVVCLTFLAGVVGGGMAVAQLKDEHRGALAAEVEALFGNIGSAATQTGPVSGSGPPTRAFAATVLAEALTGRGGVVQVVGLVALLGLSVIGAPFVLAVVFWRGFTLGFAAIFFVERFMLRGVLLALATFVPHNTLAVPAVIIAAASSIGFSLNAIVLLFGRRGGNMHGQMLRTGVMLAGSAVLLIGAALLEAYVTPVLMDTAADWLLRE